LKKVHVVKSSEVKVMPFVLDDFIQGKAMQTSAQKVTKRALKELADELGLTYDEKQIGFTKKMMTAYLER